MSDIVATLQHTISGHASDINWVAFSKDALATCSGDKTVRVWGIDDFAELPPSPLCDHTYSIHCCVFSPAGDILVSCSTDGKAIVWDSKSGKKLNVLFHKSGSSIRVCRFSHNGNLLATGSDDETICLWDTETKKPIRSLEGHEGSVVALAFSPDDSYLVTGSTNGDLRVWDACYGHGKALVLELDGHDLGVSCCEFSPTYGSAGTDRTLVTQDHFLLATCGYDNRIKLWDILARLGGPNIQLQLRNTLSGHSGRVMACCFSPDGRILASGGGDASVRLWDPLRAQLVFTIDAHSRYVTSCAFSRDGLMLASGSNDKTAKVWKLSHDGGTSGSASPEHILVDLAPQDNTEPVSASPVAPKPWTVNDVCRWLQEIGLPQYQEVFRANAIDGQELMTLTHESLERHIGIAALGHRNKILRAIQSIPKHPVIQNKIDDSGIPDEYLCPITREIMRDPVIAADGYSYERAAITSWMSSGKTRSPMTNAVLGSQAVMPNRSLKMLIQRHLQANA